MDLREGKPEGDMSESWNASEGLPLCEGSLESEIATGVYESSLESEIINQRGELVRGKAELEAGADESQHNGTIKKSESDSKLNAKNMGRLDIVKEDDTNSLPKQVKETVPTIVPKIGNEGAGTQNFNTLLKSMQNKNTSRSKASDFKSASVKDNRTFDEHSFKEKPRQNQRITDALRRVAAGVSLSQRDFGNDHWDGRKLVRALTVAPQTLASAKYSRPPQKTYFFIDTNCKNCSNEHCGWVNYSEFSMMLIASGLNSENTEVWSGSKCRPEHDERAAAQKLRKSPTLNQNIQDCIELVQPEAGSRIVFLGECYNISIEPSKLKKVLSPYKAVWLDCLDKHSSFYKDFVRTAKRRAKRAGKIATETEYELLKLAGVTVVKNCAATDGFVRGLNTIL